MRNLYQSTLAIQKLLSEAGIASIVIGGLAVAIWGEPRLTRDTDLKILLRREQIPSLLALLKPNYSPITSKNLSDPGAILEKMGFLFIKDSLGTRIDLLLAETAFDAEAIQRGCSVEVQSGLILKFCTAEDLIIYKMFSTRSRDREDVRSIIIRQKDRLDDAYVLAWLKQFEKALDDSTLIQEYQGMRAMMRGQ